MMRKHIFDIIEPGENASKISRFYDVLMIVAIIASIIPLAFKQNTLIFVIIDRVCVSLFILDYVLRILTADYKFSKSGWKPFVRYPFSVMAIIDLVSILPSLTPLNHGFRLLRLVRLARAIRVFRVFRLARYSKNVQLIINVLKRSKDPLIAVGTFAIAYVLIAALVIFNVEPDTFGNYFDAIYWATVSLTTVGYGDIYPVTDIGRLVTIISSAVGIAIIALPSGILTAGYIEEINQVVKNSSKTKADNEDDKDRYNG